MVRLIHQVWIGGEPPAWLLANAEKLQGLNPSWRHRLWREEDLRELRPINAAVIAATSSPVSRADLWRLELLHQFGGLYADLDIEWLRPLDELPLGDRLAVGQEGRVPNNHVLWAPRPGMPELLHLIRSCEGRGHHQLAAARYGPGLLMQALAGQQNINIISDEVVTTPAKRPFCPRAAGHHLYASGTFAT